MHRRCARNSQASGFTLIEVLVAMTILAVGVSALVSAAGAAAHRSGVLRDREVARWVASNHLTTLQSIPAWPDIGTKRSEVEMVRQKWFLTTKTQKVADADLRRIDVEVRRRQDADSYIYRASGFAGNPDHKR